MTSNRRPTHVVIMGRGPIPEGLFGPKMPDTGMDEETELAAFLAVAHALTDFVRENDDIMARYVEFTGHKLDEEKVVMDMAHDFFDYTSNHMAIQAAMSGLGIVIRDGGNAKPEH